MNLKLKGLAEALHIAWNWKYTGPLCFTLYLGSFILMGFYLHYMIDNYIAQTGNAFTANLELNFTSEDFQRIEVLMPAWMTPLLIVKPALLGYFLGYMTGTDWKKEGEQE